MEQPPLIDVDEENGGKTRLMGCMGCLGKLIPFGVGLLALLLVAMAGAYFIWGNGITGKGEEGAEGRGGGHGNGR